MKYRNRYILTFTILVAAWIAGGSAMAQEQVVRVGGSVYGGGNMASVGTNSEVNIETGTVAGNVYGGCNSEGSIGGNVTVTLTGGTINTAPGSGQPVKDVVFGGGKGEPTLVNGDVTVNVGTKSDATPAVYAGSTIINGNVYGGSALGNTNASRNGSTLVIDATKNTLVNLYQGTINGNVFGGGLGQKAAGTQEGIESIVGGNVTVTLDGAKIVSTFTGEGDNRMAVTGQIFGCNNLNGTPKGHVKVHVKRTIDSDKTSETALAKTRDQRTTYDVAAVYGGGNQADYEPTDASLDASVSGNPAKIAAAFAEVLIEGCDKTSIEYVYGGGNAAAVPATEVTVKGTYIIDYVFGGGNGKSTSTYDNPGADVGIIDKEAHAADPTDGNYGTGKAVTKLIGGMIHVVFGGSNTKGNVRGGTDVRMPQNDGTGDYCTTLDVREIYGAGQNAEQEGGVSLVLGCVEGLQNVYGGARNANIAGGINMTITSGTFENVFGGNDETGTIQGPITLNIEETACDPIIINNLYLGGNQAAYSVYGYYDDNGTLKPRTATDTEEAKPHVGNTTVPYANPVLNVISCTRIDNVFGGGYGTTAVMYGSPTVNINMIPGDHAEKIKRSGTANAHDLGAIGNVFGGGNLAAVEGNTTVNIGQSEYVELISFSESDVRDYYTRTGSAGSYTYTLVEGNDAVPATPGTSYYKKVEGAYITGSVYGGGNQADVTGNTAVNVCAVNSDDPATTNIVEFTGVTISGTNFEGVTIVGDVFGAGKGVNTDVTKALVSGNAIVGMAGGEVKKSVYGGGELSQVGGNTFVTVMSGTIGTPNMDAATYGNVYGGGLGATDDIRFGLIKGNTYVNISNIVADAAYHDAHTNVAVGAVLSSPTILHNIYGGGAYGSVGTFNYASNAVDAVISSLQTANTGITNVTVTGGTIGTTGQNNGMVFGSSRGDVGAPDTIHDRLAWVYDTHVTIGTSGQGTDLTNPTINGSVYGGGENGHNYHDAEVIVHSGTIGIHDGSAADATRGNVYGGGCGTDKYYSSSYSGTINDPTDGNGDTYNPLAGIVYGDASITMTGGVVNHNVYGAGAMGSVGKFTKTTTTTETATTTTISFTSGGTTTIAISGGTVGVDGNGNGDVFGAARGDKAVNEKDLALVKETGVTISSTAIIKGSVYGGGEVGNVHTNTAVNVQGGTIAMNVFGGGKGVRDLFTCEQAMVGVDGDGACQNPDATENKDKGTIVTISNGTVGTLNASNNNQLVEGTGNVYGGGEIGRVEWNTQVKIGVGTGAGPFAPEIYGSVFGAGKGLETHGYSALVRGNSTVTIQGGAKVRHNVYGGGEKSTVGRYWVNGIPATPCDANETQPTPPPGLPSGMPYQQRSGGICRVTVQGSAHIGPDAAADVSNNAGHVFGAGKGVEPHFSDGPQKMLNTNQLANFVYDNERQKTAEEVYLEFLQTLALVTNSYVTIGGSATVMGSAYGGSESGFVQTNTEVTIEGGTIGTTGTTTYGNIFGGGRGLDTFAEAGIVKGKTTVAVHGGTTYGNVYGGGELGNVKETTEVDIYAQKESNAYVPVAKGSEDVTVVGNVFGGGKGKQDTFTCEKAMVGIDGDGIANPDGGTTVIIGNGTVRGNVYGGGEVGRVEKNTVVTIGLGTSNSSAPYIMGDVFGAGAGVNTHGFSALLRGNSTVTVQAYAKVGKSVYGGGQIASVGRYVVINSLPTKPAGGGKCTVNIQGHATIGEISDGNVFGAGKGVMPYEGFTSTETPWSMKNDGSHQEYTSANLSKYFEFITTLALANDTEVTIDDDATVKGSVYGGSENGFVQRYTQVTIQGNSEIGVTSNSADVGGYVYGGGRGSNSVEGYAEAGKVKGNTTVNINSGTMHGSVFGGGEQGLVIGRVDVSMNGGTVNHDVYGGGALASTNTGNGTVCVQVPGIDTGDEVTGYYENTYIETTDEKAVANKTYYTNNTGSEVVTGLIAGESPVTGYYEWSEDTYVETQDANAVANKIYYTKTHPTTVNLLGGLINGDAYGGGLGQRSGFNSATSNIAAQVYGDVNVVLGTAKNVTPASATAFNITHYDDAEGTANYDESTIIKSGRVFGCNNLNGSPQGDVTVRVWRTVTGKLNGATNTRTDSDKKKLKQGDSGYVPHTYEVAAVYGGGNLADYTTTETGKKAYVIIETCDVSIETVYGGGNAAEVPGTDVLVKGAYEINEVFGGGNGSDPYTTDGGTTWVENSGANIGNATQAGSTNTILAGGLIHAAYGASNKKGTVYGSVSIDIGTGGDCTLDLEKMVGAGKDADVNGDLIIVLGCKPGEKIPVVYGGADNAHVNGNVEMTITSGIYENVFGGNNAGGYILGHIKLNIEERDCDTPIKIDHLYLGGNEAAYSMYGYYNAGTNDAPNYQPRTLEMTVEGTNYKAPLTEINGMTVRNQLDGTTQSYAQPELNVISCTYIGEVFGGGYGEGATLYGNPVVNINMVPGPRAEYNIDRDKNGTADGLEHGLGEIGDVFGGGDGADVVGNTTVNIGTATTVTMTSVDDDLTTEDVDEKHPTVEGAYIVGNVYGGGNAADVKGNTYVNIGAKDGVSVDIIPTTANHFEGVKILGSVYGGGNLGSVGTYTYATTANNGKNPGSEISTGTYTGKPTGFTSGTGTSRVTIMGYAEIGPDGMQMVTTSGMPDDAGHVFGASRGTVDPLYNQDFATTADRQAAIAALSAADLNAKLGRVEMLAYTDETHVTIGGHAFVKGSVYGGSENGHVLDDTNVTIQDYCQIGNGDGVNRRYTDGSNNTTNEWASGSLAECAHWPFGQQTGDFKYAPYDPFALDTGKYSDNTSTGGGLPTGDDGHTFYGNVFGGGSGYYPYAPGKWLSTAGQVYGNTFVTITGGHILTNVYGGNEMTDVTGKCTINMSAGTVGVPRNFATNATNDNNRLVTCYVFGAGKGDPRGFFNTSTNVGSTEVNISGTARVFGSTFGGGEDGHVLGDVETNIGKEDESNDNILIGTTGTSSADGNIFGGGRGFSEKALTAGVVSGNVLVNIYGGKMLGTVFGGGRLASVGAYLVLESNTGKYGKLIPDGFNQVIGDEDEAASGVTHGHIQINIYGGTIGATDSDDKLVTSSATIGDVFGGSKGSVNDLRFGLSRQTLITMSGGTVNGNVYGGGETAVVEGDTDIRISGGTVGDGYNDYATQDEAKTKKAKTGNVFGGGKGNAQESDAGCIKGITNVTISDVRADAAYVSQHEGENVSVGDVLSGPVIYHNVYGGGELGDVGTIDKSDPNKNYTWTNETGVCNVTISGGTVGHNATTDMGNVFGAGKGLDDTFWCEKAMVYRTNVSISNGTVNGNVYGGGEIGRVENHTVVTIGRETGEEEGAGTGTPDIKGNVFGAGAGVETHGYSALVRGNSNVTIEGAAGAKVEKNVYGGGEKATAGRYKIASADDVANVGFHLAHPDIEAGMPYETNSGGVCTVVVQGHAQVGPDDDDDVSDDAGHVFGAGKGVGSDIFDDAYTYEVGDRPYRMTLYTNSTEFKTDNTTQNGNTWEYYTTYGEGWVGPKFVKEYYERDAYLKFLQTLALATNTYVTINGDASVKGSVYGGSESGFVQDHTNVTIQSGNIGTTGTTYGNVFGGGKGLVTFAEAGRVRGNTTVEISGGTTYGNVYGGGELGDVGTIDKSDPNKNYIWTSNNDEDPDNDTGVCNVTVSGTTATATIIKGSVFGAGKGKDDTFECEKAQVYKAIVSIENGTVEKNVYGGGEIGRVENDTEVTLGVENAEKAASAPIIVGSVFGAGAGKETHGYSALVRGDAKVTVQGNAWVKHNVYGGGELASVGRYWIKTPTLVSGQPDPPSGLPIGMPYETRNGGECTVIVQDNAQIGTDAAASTSNDAGSVFGAGKGVEPRHFIGVDTYVNQTDMPWRMTTDPGPGKRPTYCDVLDNGAIKEYYATKDKYYEFLETLALATDTKVTISEDAAVKGTVFGGGQRGITRGSVEVTVSGGTIEKDVYGGGALANTNTNNWNTYDYVEYSELTANDPVTGYYERSGSGTDTSPYVYTLTTDQTAVVGKKYYSKGNWVTKYYNSTTYNTTYTTKVTLTSGVINGDVYGGGLGRKEGEEETPAQGEVGEDGYVPAGTVHIEPVEAKVFGDVLVTLNKNGTAEDGDNCVVKGSIFGCNNENGSPQNAVTVHIYKTQGYEGHWRTAKNLTGDNANAALDDPDDTHHSYELLAVYGGGNQAAFRPDLQATCDSVQPRVIIDGCELTSIRTVYGGGNAASVPATNVKVNAAYEIEEVFGGGNGYGKMPDGSDNPGANVGYTYYDPQYDPPASSKTERTNLFSYGSGKANVDIVGGRIHRVFGGSNTKGNVRESAVTILQDLKGCVFSIDEAYGGGKNAPMDAKAELLMACIPGLKAAYGGAQDADIQDDVTLTITNGTFDRVFGGNNVSGKIHGTITVTIEETGCQHLIIGQLYGGGNQAPYEAPEGKDGPTLNVKSFTSIGDIYGGGYGETAVVKGDTHVNINVCEGKYAGDAFTEEPNHKITFNEYRRNKDGSFVLDANGERVVDQKIIGVLLPGHEKDKIGAINNVFGGGNAAPVQGSTNVNIGTLSDVYVTVVDAFPEGTILGTTEGYTDIYTFNETTNKYVAATGEPNANVTYYKKLSVVGVDIRGNVYGGGNAAEVTGDTNVVIGKEAQ